MQNKPKVAYLFENCPNGRDFDRFFINNFIENGFSTIVLDLSKILKQSCVNPDSRVKEKIIKCKNILETFITLSKFKPNYVFVFINKTTLRCYIKRLLIINVVNIFFRTIEYCGPNGPFHSPLQRKYKLLKDILFRYIYTSENYSIVSGTESLKRACGSPIHLHTADYDLYLLETKKDIVQNANYILFLDEDYVFHEDYLIIGMEAPVTVENYYYEVNLMLKKLGDTFGLRPIIQVHPSADRKLARKYYDFPLSEEKTINAVKNADIIVSHDSTALQMAVFWNKPVILLETKEIIASEKYHQSVHNFSESLGCSVFTIEDFKKDIEFPVVCEQSYALYMQKYVKIDLPDQRYSYEILASFLENQVSLKTK